MSKGSRRRRAAVYADAVTADADATDSWLDWEMDLEVLEALVSDEAGRRFLQNTGISLADRMEAVQRAVGDSMSPRGVGLLQLVAEQRDIDLVGEIRVHVRRASDEALCIDRVHVTTAMELEEVALQELSSSLEKHDRNLRLTTEVDEKLLGGFIVRRGDDVLDLSVRARLESLAATLR